MTHREIEPRQKAVDIFPLRSGKDAQRPLSFSKSAGQLWPEINHHGYLDVGLLHKVWEHEKTQ